MINILEEDIHRDGFRAAVISKVEHFLIIVNGLQPFTIITKRSNLDVAAALDPDTEGTRRITRNTFCFKFFSHLFFVSSH